MTRKPSSKSGRSDLLGDHALWRIGAHSKAAVVKALMASHAEWMYHRIAVMGTLRRMKKEDIEDAQSIVLFVILEALEKHPSGPSLDSRQCRTVLRRLLHERFADHAKRCRRVEAHFDNSAQARQWVQFTRANPSDVGFAAIERRELSTRLDEFLAGLGKLGPVWDALILRKTVAQMCRELQISYATGKRWKAKLLAMVREFFANSLVGGSRRPRRKSGYFSPATPLTVTTTMRAPWSSRKSVI